jgi:hypothetical protein
VFEPRTSFASSFSSHVYTGTRKCPMYDGVSLRGLNQYAEKTLKILEGPMVDRRIYQSSWLGH